MICLRIACRNVAQAHVLSRTLDEMEYDGMPPNVLRFSCRRGAQHQKARKRLLGGPAQVLSLAGLADSNGQFEKCKHIAVIRCPLPFRVVDFQRRNRKCRTDRVTH